MTKAEHQAQPLHEAGAGDGRMDYSHLYHPDLEPGTRRAYELLRDKAHDEGPGSPVHDRYMALLQHWSAEGRDESQLLDDRNVGGIPLSVEKQRAREQFRRETEKVRIDVNSLPADSPVRSLSVGGQSLMELDKASASTLLAAAIAETPEGRARTQLMRAHDDIRAARGDTAVGISWEASDLGAPSGVFVPPMAAQGSGDPSGYADRYRASQPEGIESLMLQSRDSNGVMTGIRRNGSGGIEVSARFDD